MVYPDEFTDEFNIICNKDLLDYVDLEDKEAIEYLIDTFKDAKEIGSLLILEKQDYTRLEKSLNINTTIFKMKPSTVKIVKIGFICIIPKPLSNKRAIIPHNTKDI